MAQTWLINETPTYNGNIFIINFSSNNTEYVEIIEENNNDKGSSYYRHNVLAYHTSDIGVVVYDYNTTTWTNQAYRTVTFETAPTGYLLTWLQSNAVLQPEPVSSNSIKFGNSSISKLYFGSSEVDKVYFGSEEVYSKAVTYTITATATNVTANPLTASVSSGGSQTFTLTADGTSYKLPTSITVEGTTINAGTSTVITDKCTVLFTRTSDTAGTIAFSNVMDDVSFSVVGEAIPSGYNVTMINPNETGYDEAWNIWIGCDTYGVDYVGFVDINLCTNVKTYDNSIARAGTTHTISIDRRYIVIEPDKDWYNLTVSGGIALVHSQDMQQVYEITGDCTISASSECLTGDTLVTMADNSTKRLDEIELGDEILSYNWETMQLVPNKVIFTDKDANKSFVEYDKWTFDDGTVVKTVHRHEFYNVEAKRFKYMDEWEIGEHTYKQDGTTPMLISHETIKEEVRHYKITGELGTNYFANGLLTGDRNCPKDIDLIN